MSTYFDSLPPHDDKAEAAVIGSAMVGDIALRRELLAMLQPEHFLTEDRRIVWAAIAALVGRGVAVDAVTVRAELADGGKLDDAGGTVALTDMLNEMPSATNGRHYADIVLRDARRRALWRISTTTAGAAWESKGDPVALAHDLRHRLDALLRQAGLSVRREGGAAEVAALLADEAAGRRQSVSLPWPLLGRITRCLLPGTMTLLAGDPGAGKTFLLLEALNHWTREGVSAAMLMLERERAWHLRRCLALLLGDLRTLNDEAVRGRPDWYTSRPGEHADTLDATGRRLWDTTQCGSTLSDIAAWVDQRADAGDRVIAVDPLSLADATDKPWIEHADFCRAVRRSIERTGASLILATHPRGGHRPGSPTMDDLAGSRVFIRRADSVLWLRRPGMRQATCVAGLSAEAERTTAHVDRVVSALKCRDGSAGGLDFGYQWHRTAGGFVERGVIEDWLTEPAGELPEGL